MKSYLFHFDKKSVANGGVIIEGFSNKNVPDRTNERMYPQGGRFDNYNKNPIVLFNHGKDEAFGIMPIGKSLQLQANDAGIYTKCSISNSKTEKITVVRDLIQEEILKTFSLGYETLQVERDGDGVDVLTDWELLEQSIVPIPMNADSTFGLSKRYQRMGNRFGVKYFERSSLVSKGCLVAAALQRLVELRKAQVAGTIESVSSVTGIKSMQLREIFAGDRPACPVSIHGFAVVLGVKDNELYNLRKMEADMAKKKGEKSAPPAKKPDEKPADGPPSPVPSPDAEKPDAPPADAPPKKPKLVLHTISVPKAMYDEAENARGFVEAHGYKADQMNEDDTHYHFGQAATDGLDMANGIDLDMGDNVVGKAAPICDQPQQAPEQKSETPPPPEVSIQDADKPDTKAPAATPQELLRQSLESGTNTEIAKQLVKQALDMLGEGKSAEKAAPMPSGSDAVQQDENPFLMQARQTNVLLGTLIQEIQMLSQKVAAAEQEDVQEDAQAAEDGSGDQSDPGMIKRLAELKKYQQTTESGLKRLGV